MPAEDPHRIVCHLGSLLESRGMTLTTLSEKVGVSIVNLSILKNQRAKAIRFSTLTALCDALDCTVAELMTIESDTRGTADGTHP
ncbi:MAG TPA: helix-turn-helix domain-containing protein [Candidatus Stackebrandtia faecavium]|nr:helix-turn-helix domain-containing protein [Candidatus Stackebrandtia faecavium]